MGTCSLTNPSSDPRSRTVFVLAVSLCWCLIRQFSLPSRVAVCSYSSGGSGIMGSLGEGNLMGCFCSRFIVDKFVSLVAC